MKPYEILRLLVYNLHLSEVGWLRFLDLKSRRKQEMAPFQNKQIFKNYERYQITNSKSKQKFAKKAHKAKSFKLASLVPLTDDREN